MKKIIKLVSAALVAFVIVFGVAGCAIEDAAISDSVSNEDEYRFNICEYSKSSTKVIVDTETGVQYLCYTHNGGYNGFGIGMTLLVNPDGTPMLVEGYEYE